jgi:hypothetical protein
MSKRLVVGLILLFGCVACLAPLQTIRGDGSLPLSVTVVSESDSPIASLSCEPFSTAESARFSLEYLVPPETTVYAAVQDPFLGEPLEVTVRTSDTVHGALLWSHSRYNQVRQLLVIAQYCDGRQEGRLVEIPDLRQVRSLRVEFP